MTTTLRVLIPEHWPSPAGAHWVILDSNGVIVNSGNGEPRSWPVTDRTEAVLHGPQTSWIKVKVPKAGVREQALAIGFALEEQIVREADSQHITPTLQEDESWHVIIIGRERLKQLVTQFEVISRPLDAAYSVLENFPAASDAWSFGVDDYGFVVRTGLHGGWVEDRPVNQALPYLFQAAIAEARATTTLPSRLVCHTVADLPLASWGNELGLEIERGENWAWYKIANNANDLLHGEFMPQHRRKAWQRALRPALVMLAIILGAHLLLGTAYAWWRRAEVRHIDASIEQLMRSQLPNQPLLDPAAQVKRELNTQRSQHGLLAEDSALSLLADFSAALGPDANAVIRSLRYQDGTLDLALAGKPDIESLRTRLETRGLSINQREGDGRIAIRRLN